jgi:hypothetical protein
VQKNLQPPLVRKKQVSPLVLKIAEGAFSQCLQRSPHPSCLSARMHSHQYPPLTQGTYTVAHRADIDDIIQVHGPMGHSIQKPVKVVPPTCPVAQSVQAEISRWCASTIHRWGTQHPNLCSMLRCPLVPFSILPKYRSMEQPTSRLRLMIQLELELYISPGALRECRGKLTLQWRAGVNGGSRPFGYALLLLEPFLAQIWLY